MQTEMGREFQAEFSQTALRQIAKGARDRAEWLADEFEAVEQRAGVNEAAPYAADSRAMLMLAESIEAVIGKEAA